MRKERSDSKFAALQPQQRQALTDWLLDGMGYADAKEKLYMDYGFETSETALSGFYQRYCAPLRLRRAADAARELPELVPDLMDGTDASSVALLKQSFFELLAARERDPKAVLAFGLLMEGVGKAKLEREKLKTRRQETALRTRLKRKDQALSQAKFNALERRNAEAREKLNAMVQAKGGLTPQTIQQIEEALSLL